VKKSKVREFKSPIETQLRNAIVRLAEDNESLSISLSDYSTSKESLRLVVNGGKLEISNEFPDMEEKYRDWGDGDFDLSLYADVAIASYRVDLLLVSCDAMLAIECDGHEWHDRTKQQASSDRARDRDLLGRGLPVIRFTGSDIVHNATECAAESYGLIRRLQERADAINDKAIAANGMGFDTGYKRGFEDGELREGVYLSHVGIYAGILSGLG
jgi:very-short-patch-repair endonuclease